MPSYRDVAIAAARRAGALQLAGLQQPIVVRQVSEHDVKLQMDLDCEEAIREMLLRAFPDHAVLAEEGGGAIAPDVPTWIIDPLDGTVNYSRHLPYFCVSIALHHEGQVQLGVIYAAIRDELFVAERGRGAWLNDAPVHVSGISELGQAVITVGCGKSQLSRDAMLDLLHELTHRAHKIRICGAAALDMAYVATGHFDGFAECGLRTWDIAAGSLLVREAGGRVELTSLGNETWDVRVDNGRLW